MRRKHLSRFACTIASLYLMGTACAQSQGFDVRAELRAPVGETSRAAKVGLPPAVLWMKPLGTRSPWPTPRGNVYTLLQKNKMFSPHLLVVPVGTVVLFPNRDSFFHNAFSLFDGKRFDLGLYEAGKTKEVLFSREGISYIFCNIHSEMSAVVIALTTPLYGVADRTGAVLLHDVPVGDYEMHLWVEGQSQAVLDHWIRQVHIAQADQDLGVFFVSPASGTLQHANKFGHPYDVAPDRSY